MSLVLVFEGIDKTGKDTVIAELNKISKFRHPIINRFTGTQIVYGLFKKRFKKNSNQYRELIALEHGLKEYVVVIYLTASNATIAVRMADTGETDIKVSDIPKLKKLYEEYTKDSPFLIIEVNTDVLSAKEIAEFIWKRLNI